MTINANFTGMSNPNQSILFLSNSCGMLLPGPWRKPPASWNLRFSRFSGEFHSSCLQYKHLIRTCQEPGLNIYGGNPPTSREALTPGARCVEVPTQKPRTSAIYYWGSLGVWRCLQDPGNLKLQQKPQKTVIFHWGVWEFHVPGRPVTWALIHRLSTGY